MEWKFSKKLPQPESKPEPKISPEDSSPSSKC